MTPHRLGDKPEHWLSWTDEVRDYLEQETPGIKDVLRSIEGEEASVDATWVINKFPPGASQ